MAKKAAKKESANTGNITIATYSEKAFVVYGDTKPLKDMLKTELKLRYNPRLKCGAGWIGSMKHVDDACELLGVELVKMTTEQLVTIGAKRAKEKEAAVKE